ncbi:hypothetical protein ACJZ2D_009239 [Fusarium nematophilum]
MAAWTIKVIPQLSSCLPYLARFKALTCQTAASCSIFIAKQMKCIDHLVGDDSFSRLSQGALVKRSAAENLGLGSAHALPLPDIMDGCSRVFLTSINKYFPFFQHRDIEAIFESYIQSAEGPSLSWYAALNMVCAHSLGLILGTQNERSEECLQNSLRAMPGLILEPPNAVMIGTLLSAVWYLLTTSRSSSAAVVLGMASQMILLAGYHGIVAPSAKDGCPTGQKLHQSRLFWQAYILDREISLMLDKPPSLLDDFIPGEPDLSLVAGLGAMSLPGGLTVNYFLERATLARIQSKVYRKLRSSLASSQSCEEFLLHTSQLNEELEQWKSRLPPSLMPPRVPMDVASDESMCIAVLHCSYYQTLAAIHSAVFAYSPFFNNPVYRSRVPEAVSRCACAARDLISLFTQLGQSHALTLYLICHISWSIDGLFLHILLKKSNALIQRDIEHLKAILDCFEEHLPRHKGGLGYRAIAVVYKVASMTVTKEPSR